MSAAGDGELRLLEGTQAFTHVVPYRLHLPPGPGEPVPLLVALHGKGDTATRFEEEALEALPDGWGLLVPSGPIPRDARPGREPALGDSWYLYDGDTPTFRRSLGRAEQFLLEIMTRLRIEAWDRLVAGRRVDSRRVALLGFSQGGYLAGMAAVRHPEIFRALVIVGGRLKTEALGPWLSGAKGQPVLHLHGNEDKHVDADRGRKSIEAAADAGLDATFEEMDGGHEFNPAMRVRAREWLSALW